MSRVPVIRPGLYNKEFPGTACIYSRSAVKHRRNGNAHTERLGTHTQKDSRVQAGGVSMKIYAYEVRDDEIDYFTQAQKKFDADIILKPQLLTCGEIRTLEPHSAISILGLERCDKDELDSMAMQDIRYLATRTVGYDHIDLEYAKKVGIHVCNVGYAPDGVADFTIMLMLMCLRNYKQALWRAHVNDFSLNGLMGRELSSLTVGIMGTGRIGARVARDLSGFGCRILAYNRHPVKELEDIVTYVTQEEIYRQCDIITLHLPLTQETYHMINANTIRKMKDGVVLINCARGALMDMDSLIDAVETSKIGALGMDCVENEEGIIHLDRRTDIFSDRKLAYLRQFKNVVHTQHMAFYTDGAVRSMVDGAIQGILDMAGNRPCRTQLV